MEEAVRERRRRGNKAKRKGTAQTRTVIETMAILAREKVNLKHGPSRCWPLVERPVGSLLARGTRQSRRWEGSAVEDERQQKETSIPVWWVFVLELLSLG